MHIFKVKTGKQTIAQQLARKEIAAAVNAEYVYIKEPSGAYKGWYETTPLGFPGDRRIEERVEKLESLHCDL